MTHCAGLVGCAVLSDDSVVGIGVDAEPLSASKNLSTIVDRFAGPGERRWMQQEDRPRSLTLVELWTAKEAVLKARGVGLASSKAADSLENVACRFVAEVDRDTSHYEVVGGYTVCCSRLDSGHVLSVALPSPLDERRHPAPEKYDLSASGP
jgi:phosphopantetheine--protein transferase-like protein